MGAEIRNAMNQDSQLKAALKKFGSALLALLVIVLVVHDVFGTHGYLAMRRTQNEINRVNGDLDRLNKENFRLQGEVKELQTDKHAIEKIARDELGLVGERDVVIKTSDSRSWPQETTQKR
jgi:cell division protein FtsL